MRPNILIVMTDHQRGDTVLPEHPCRTPNLDRLCAEGVAFTETFCPSPHCCPSRATFFTSQMPSVHGVWNNICNPQALSRGVRPGVRMWSEDLRQAGYDLAFTGKWHVSVDEDPKDRGWRELRPCRDRHTLHGQTWDHWLKLAGKPQPPPRQAGEIVRPGWGNYQLYGVNEAGGHDEAVTADAVAALPQLAAGDKPWCLFVGLVGPHDPYFAPQRFLDLYRIEDVPLPPSYSDRMRDKPGLYQRMRDQIWGQLSELEVREARRHFWACCSHLDDMFGRILAALEATGQADNTMVVYTSDHGDYCGDHGLFAKSIPCFRGAYNVPNVIRWPGGVRSPGRRVDAFASLADLGPTFLEAAGVAADRPTAGASLMPFLQDRPPQAWRDEIHTQCNGVEVYATQRSVTTRSHKYVYNAFDRDELYDLAADPHEMVNRADDPAMRQIVRDMVGRMWRHAHRHQDTAHNNYITIALAPWGPADAFGPSGTRRE